MDYKITLNSGERIIVKRVVDSFRGDGLIILELMSGGRNFYNIDVVEYAEVIKEEDSNG